LKNHPKTPPPLLPECGKAKDFSVFPQHIFALIGATVNMSALIE
jgi:hypothetical protein